MKSRIGFLIFLFVIFIALDIYSYFGMKLVFAPKFTKLFNVFYIATSLLTYFSMFRIMQVYTNNPSIVKSETLNLMLGFVFTMFVTKLFFSVFLILQDGGRLLAGGYNYIKSLIGATTDASETFIPERRKFLTTAGTVLAGIPFFSMLYGITKGKYQYTVQKTVLSFKNLPKAFDGFKIVQISDIHSGSFDSIEKVRTGIDKINELEADIVCFTGDLVNAEKEEIDPYITTFSEIKAKYGKFATLGNHDYYGSYDRNDVSAERKYFEDFFEKFKKMGLDLLNNENRKLTIDDESIHIVGVENWGAGHWFPKKGDLTQATNGISDDNFKLLMSHDPTHWDEKVLNFPMKMDLTLSGHTHGFQFGFQMPGFKWSPAKYRYPKWLGLYQEKDQYLYVNRGFGFLGFPGRVGMWPEITLIELRVG